MAEITCQICGKTAHSIQLHLRDEHPDVSLDQYKADYPDAPLLSPEAMEVVKKRKAQQSGARIDNLATAQIAGGGVKTVELHKLFGVPAKSAMAANGNAIQIKVSPKPADADSAAMVPEHDDAYIYDVALLKSVLMALGENIPLYLYGPPGVGKSSMPRNVCAKTNRPLVRVQHTPNTEESHIVGEKSVRNVPCEKSGELRSETYFELGPLPLAMINGWVYMADEYDRAWPSVLSVYQAVLEGQPLYIKEAPPELRMIKPHPDFRFIATGNTNGSGDETGRMNGTVEQDAATIERFGIVEYVDYMDPKREALMLRQQVGLRADDAERLVRFASAIRQSYPSTISLTIGNRVLINIAKLSLMRGNFLEGVRQAFANRLPDSEKTAALEVAQRELGAA